jgi:tRNA(Ile)-lysidine synthase
MFNDGLRVGFREGGEKIKLHGHQHHKSLKTLWQEWAVPPWERDRIPLLFYDNELIAVVGYGLSESCQLMTGQEGYLPLLKSV